MNSQFKLILFDYGGVIFTFPNMDQFGYAAELTGAPRENIVAEYWKHNHLTNVHNLPWVEAFLAAVKKFDDSAEIETKLREQNNRYLTGGMVNQVLIDKVESLKSAGYQVAILSNFTSELHDELKENQLDQVFEHVFVSGELGYQKPQPEAFEAVFANMEVTPQEVVFIDDTPRSLSTADQIGYAPILYKDNEQLFAELDRLGIA